MEDPYGYMARNATYERYKYAINLYTYFFIANQTGMTFFDPMFYQWPYLEKAYENIEHTFMVHNAIKVSPVL